MPIYTRQCPICNKNIDYTHLPSFEEAIRANKPCISCGKRKNGMPIEKVDLLKKMIVDGLFKKDIMRELEISDAQYRHLISKFDLKTNKETSIKIIDAEVGLAECSECHRILPLEENFFFKVKTNGYRFYQTYCYDCHYKKRNDHLTNDRGAFLKESYSSLKSGAKQKGIPFTISKEDYINQYYAQNGKCFYTDLEMVCRAGEGTHRYALSVDKIIPEIGYTKQNVVFCCYKINTCKLDLTLEEIKKWMPSWYERIEKFLGKNHD